MSSLQSIVIELERLIPQIENAMDEALANPEIAETLRTYWRLKLAYEALDEQRKKLYGIYDKANKHTLPTRLIDSDLDKVGVPDLGRSFYILKKQSASILDKEKGYEWLHGNGLGDLITETVNAGTLAAALKHFILETGKEPDPEIIRYTEYNMIGTAKYTPKG